MEYTIIESQGQKWLRPIDPNPLAHFDHTFQKHNPDLIYIGSKPAGSTVDESEVKPILQAKFANGQWREIPGYGTGIETRTAYTDVEPVITGRHLLSEQREEWFRKNSHLLNMQQYGHPAIHHKSVKERKVNELTALDQNLLDAAKTALYWHDRAVRAEKLIEMGPSDPKTYDEFCRLRDEWQQLVKQEPK